MHIVFKTMGASCGHIGMEFRIIFFFIKGLGLSFLNNQNTEKWRIISIGDWEEVTMRKRAKYRDNYVFLRFGKEV